MISWFFYIREIAYGFLAMMIWKMEFPFDGRVFVDVYAILWVCSRKVILVWSNIVKLGLGKVLVLQSLKL